MRAGGKARRRPRKKKKRGRKPRPCLSLSAWFVRPHPPQAGLKKPRLCCAVEDGQVLFLDVTARKRGPWCRQRGREPSRKRGRHCSIYRCRRHCLALFRSSSSLSFVLLFVVRLAHLVPATAPPRLTRPGPAAAWLVAEAAAEAAAVQAT